MAMKQMKLKCPNCGKYIFAPIMFTRVDNDGVFRRRKCENCNTGIETLEQVTRFYKRQVRKHGV